MSIRKKIIFTTVLIIVLYALICNYSSLRLMNYVARYMPELKENLITSTLAEINKGLQNVLEGAIVENTTNSATHLAEAYKPLEHYALLYAKYAEEGFAQGPDPHAEPLPGPRDIGDDVLTTKCFNLADDPKDIKRIDDFLRCAQEYTNIMESVTYTNPSVYESLVYLEGGGLVLTDFYNSYYLNKNNDLRMVESSDYLDGIVAIVRDSFDGSDQDSQIPDPNHDTLETDWLLLEQESPIVGRFIPETYKDVIHYMQILYPLKDSKGSIVGFTALCVDVDQYYNSISNNLAHYQNNVAILTEDDSVLFSSNPVGILDYGIWGEDLTFREKGNSGLAALVEGVRKGNPGINKITINDKNVYCAAAAIPGTGGWVIIKYIDEDSLDTGHYPVVNTISEILDKKTEDMLTYTDLHSLFVLVMGIIGSIISIIAAVITSDYISRSIKKLTKKISSMDGNNLDFKWDGKSKDETMVLGKAFERLTEDMKTYIHDIQEITAQNERINAELSLAAKIQANALPKVFPPFPDKECIDIYASMNPAKEVGGDFYDFFLVDDNKLALIIADVSGKGVPAALFMMTAKTVIRNSAMAGFPPAQCLKMANAELCRGNEELMFVTAYLLIMDLNTGSCQYSNAGHEPPAVMRSGQDFEFISPKPGLMLGVDESFIFEPETLTLNKGDKIFLFTDGATDGINKAQEIYGEVRLLSILNRVKDLGPAEILPRIKEDIDTFCQGEEQFDDITMLCFCYNPDV